MFKIGTNGSHQHNDGQMSSANDTCSVMLCRKFFVAPNRRFPSVMPSTLFWTACPFRKLTVSQKPLCFLSAIHLPQTLSATKQIFPSARVTLKVTFTLSLTGTQNGYGEAMRLTFVGNLEK